MLLLKIKNSVTRARVIERLAVGIISVLFCPTNARALKALLIKEHRVVTCVYLWSEKILPFLSSLEFYFLCFRWDFSS